jgi:micrococcal nuclease
MYTYNAHVTKVYDGDTITVDIDLGLGVWMKGQKIRLYGINAPEMRGADKANGKISRDWLREAIMDKDIVIVTRKDKKGKYGRWVGTIWTKENFTLIDNCISINEEMILRDLALKAEY